MCKSHGKVRTDGAGVGSGWITQTTEVKLARGKGDPWERITAQAKADMLHKGRLFWAVESMIREQAHAPLVVDSIPASQTDERCDHCGRPAVWTWERSAAYMKKHAGRKVKGARLVLQPVSWRCSLHVPHFAPELASEYRDARVVRVSVEAVA